MQKSLAVIPAKAGIQSFQDVLDLGFRRGDCFVEFCKSLAYLLISDGQALLVDPVRDVSFYLETSKEKSEKITGVCLTEGSSGRKAEGQGRETGLQTHRS